MSDPVSATYVGQVERDADGALWAVLYCGEHEISKEQVRSLRKGKRRVADLLLSANDTFVELRRTSPVHLNRLVVQQPTTVHRRGAARSGPAHPTAGTSGDTSIPADLLSS